jgi:hypothetical protein
MLFMLWVTVRLLTRLLVFLNDEDGTKDLERARIGVEGRDVAGQAQASGS